MAEALTALDAYPVTVPPPTDEQAFLQVGLSKLLPLLAARGFAPDPMETGRGHMPFATVTLRRGTLEVGLIVRERHLLRCPNYSAGRGYVGHDDLLRALNPHHPAALVPAEAESIHYRAADGGDPFNALRADLVAVLLPALAADEARLRRILAAEVARRMTSWGVRWDPGPA